MVKINLELTGREVMIMQDIFHNEIRRLESTLSEKKLGNAMGNVSSVELCDTVRGIMWVEVLQDKFLEALNEGGWKFNG